MKIPAQIPCVLLLLFAFRITIAQADLPPDVRASTRGAGGSVGEGQPRPHRNTSLVAPVTLLSVAAVSMITGGAVFASLESDDEACDVGTCYPAAAPVGKALMIGGAGIALVGLVMLPIRMVARMQTPHAAGRVYRTERARLSPWITMGASAGMSLGVSGAMQF
jgi:hypothetical protein